MAKRLTEKQKKIIINSFRDGTTVDDLSKEFKCTTSTIIRNLKKELGEKTYKELANKFKNFIKNNIINNKNINISESDSEIKSSSNNLEDTRVVNKNNSVSNQSSFSEFTEIPPLDFEIENSSRKELSSVPINESDLPKVVYMIVDKKNELEIKLLKDYPDWDFLPNEDLNRKTIEIYLDMKIAKRICSKEQKVIKVPNTDVFRIAAPILNARGISRIVSPDKLIAL